MIEAHPHLLNVVAYTPGASPEQVRLEFGLSNVEKLASNENPRGSSKSAISAAQEALHSAHLYADGGMALRQRLAQHHNVTVDAISVQNGSDAIIHQVMRVFLLPGEHALSSKGTFVSFQLAVHAAGSTACLVPLTTDYRFDVKGLASAVTDKTKVIYIANPNNPTGTHLTHDEVVWLLDAVPSRCLVVIDEAYVEYASHLAPTTYPDMLSLRYQNVICLRTFSKAYGLAALRVGYAIGDPSVVGWLIKTKLPFDPNGPACAAAIAALDDQDFVRETVELNAVAIGILSSTLIDSGYTISRSVANFVMIDCGTPQRASNLHKDLLFAGFITRPLVSFGLPSCLRITTGTEDQNARIVQVLRELSVAQTDAILPSPSIHQIQKIL